MNPSSFESLAVPELEAVYRVACRLTRDAHEAEDLVQETYLKAQRAFSRFEIREFGIRPWLLRILHNTFLNRSAAQKRAPRSAAQHVLDQAEIEEASGAPPDLDFESVDEEVKRAIDDLPAEFRSALLLWATMELSYQEIATILNTPIGTVMSRLHRARTLLSRSLHDYARANRLVNGKTDS